MEIDIDPALLDATVPTLLLQPLVENAIRHGIARKTASGLIRLTARGREDRLELQVIDDGSGFARSPARTSGGIGLENTRRRIAQPYGREAVLSHTERAGGGTVATVVIPLRHHEPTAVTEPAGAA